MSRSLPIIVALILGGMTQAATADKNATDRKKVVIIAGKKSHGPEGNGIHDYPWSARLLKVMLDRSTISDQVETEFHLHGWPKDPSTLEDADTIMVISDGRDGDKYEEAPFLRSAERMKFIKTQIDRGCGFLTFHFSTFAPDSAADQVLDWTGGYFDWQGEDGKRQWYSAIKTLSTDVELGSPDHPISRGLTPFRMKDEFYYNIRFRESDPRLKPIWIVPELSGPRPNGGVVAWAVERPQRGRGFGTTAGHFYANWKNEHFRKMILNAIAWTAGVEVPERGVDAPYLSHEEIERALSGDDTGSGDVEPIDVLIVTGHQHPSHKWQETTPALADAVRAVAPGAKVTITEHPEDLARPDLSTYDVVVMNYCNWKRHGLSQAAKDNFTKYLREGGGLAIIHFANGAFHFSLQGADKSDWPEWRSKICRRVWDHSPGAGRSGHDRYGSFLVEIDETNHPITQGMKPFETIDELYFRQKGTEPIEVLATARSEVTGKHEPMAFVYPYGEGRVFQTVLGHAEQSIRLPGPATLIGRGIAWAADRPLTPVASTASTEPKAKPEPSKETLVDGRFGKALNARASTAAADQLPGYAESPLTVECWAKIDAKRSYNILIAQELKASGAHWELFTMPGTGFLTAYLPGMTPDHARSKTNICDNRWHYVAMILEEKHVRLFVDGKQVADQAVEPTDRKRVPGPLAFGRLASGRMGCAGLLDEVRISSVARAIGALPETPFEPDAATLGLWHFDNLDQKLFPDASATTHPARIKLATEPVPSANFKYHLDDPNLKIVKIDSSKDESFLSLRADAEGRLFVGGREALFVYEPNETGGYYPRHLLFRFPPDTWINDLEIRGDDVYCMTPGALYVFPDARVKREHPQPKRLIWGTPVDLHVTYHGLGWGPEGNLYFASGDPLLRYGLGRTPPDHWGHWTIHTQPKGSVFPFTGTGAFYRCQPDGSELAVVAQGTRGSCGLAFDRDWNLFSNDNDHESNPKDYVPGRLLHVAPKANFFWPRGWMAVKTPQRADLLRTMFDGMGRAVPVGQSYYHEEFLPEEYRDSLLVARWGQRRIDRYPLARRGASFSAEQKPLLIGEGTARPVGVTVGRGGRIFAAISDMKGNAYSPKYPSDLIMITRKNDRADHPFESYDITSVDPDRLWGELESKSWWRRQRAHVEILRRGGTLLDNAIDRLATSNATSPSRPHLVWLVGASGSEEARSALTKIAQDPADPLRLQAIRALGEFSQLETPRELFIAALEDDDPAIKHAAMTALFDRPGPLPQSLWEEAARDQDSYLRQAAAFLSAEQATIDELRSLCQASDVPGRLAGVLATGFRLTVPANDAKLPDDFPVHLPRSGSVWDAKTTLHYADGTVDNLEHGRIGSFTTADHWNRIKETKEATQLRDLLAERLRDDDNAVRSQAEYFLSLLHDEKTDSLMARLRQQREDERMSKLDQRTVPQVWTIGPFASGDADAQHLKSIESGPVDLSGTFGSHQWRVMDTKKPTASESGSPGTRYHYFRLASFGGSEAQLDVPGTFRLWLNGVALPPGKDMTRFDLQPGSNDLLVRLDGTSPGDALIRYRATGQVAAILPENLGGVTLAERLRSSGSTPENLEAFLGRDWAKEAAKGNAERGRKLFGADGLGCVKCHGILPNQAAGGAPSLADARRRFAVAHLVESILAPNKQVAPLFRSTMIVTTDGDPISGLVVGEEDEVVHLLLPNATRRSIRKDEIEVRRLQKTSPMPAGLVKTPEELRDLLAYLRGKTVKAP
ncbi:Trehalose utilization [Planctomycetes bacterium Pan216]|uniref:Trehalose utilization n=1 Tax=Kolteria novifilia TaxID=2527975 RepID=A0A518AYT0_9BACT|nr:Trehalose utilization [Planctomycetes bacterium Pan216]